MRQHITQALSDEENMEIFEVASIEKRTRKGVIHPTGREEISKRVFSLLLCDIADRLAADYASYLDRTHRRIAREHFGSF